MLAATFSTLAEPHAVLGGQIEVGRQGRQQHDHQDIQGADDEIQRPAEAGGDPRRRLLAEVRQPGPQARRRFPTAPGKAPRKSIDG